MNGVVAHSAIDQQHEDLDWIFENGPELAEGCSGFTVTRLAKCFTEHSLWGPRGEGYVWFENARATMAAADPYLRAKDKEGWLAYCEQIKRDIPED